MKKLFTVILVVAVACFFATTAVAFEIGTGAYFKLAGGSGFESLDSYKRGQKTYGLSSVGAAELEFGSFGMSKGRAPGPSNSATGLDFSHVQGSEASSKIGKTYNHTKIEGYTHTNVDP